MSSKESEVLNSLEREQYRGKWIAVLDSKIIAQGKDLSEVYAKAMSVVAKDKTPLFEHIPEEEEEETLIL